jgi:hypothetical protein
MKTQVRALDSFSHGRQNPKRGETIVVGQGEAEDLEKAGLVEIVGEAPDDPEEKIAPITSNKMAPKPANKVADQKK